MTGFEPKSSGIRSNCAVDFVATTATLIGLFLSWIEIAMVKNDISFNVKDRYTKTSKLTRKIIRNFDFWVYKSHFWVTLQNR